MIHEPAVLIEGVLFRARYLGSTQLVCEGQPTKSTRMMQAEEAVSRIKVYFLYLKLLILFYDYTKIVMYISWMNAHLLDISSEIQLILHVNVLKALYEKSNFIWQHCIKLCLWMVLCIRAWKNIELKYWSIEFLLPKFIPFGFMHWGHAVNCYCYKCYKMYWLLGFYY